MKWLGEGAAVQHRALGSLGSVPSPDADLMGDLESLL